jgi:hypothetical protein
MTSEVNRAILGLRRRAETNTLQDLATTFVSAGPVGDLLQSVDHQVVFGRRGTGKTHALSYAAQLALDRGELPVMVDMRTIGSSGGLYSDDRIPVPERATRLLVDVLTSLWSTLTDYVFSEDAPNATGLAVTALEDLATEVAQVKVAGSFTLRQVVDDRVSHQRSTDARAQLSVKPSLQAGGSGNDQVESHTSAEIERSGQEQCYVHISGTQRKLQRAIKEMGCGRLWIFLDEWSSIPLVLQPYLADMVRRALLPTQSISVKIGAIEHRSNFMLPIAGGDYVGIELGGDVTADLDLDDFMVFDNDSARSTAFFAELFTRHINAVSGTAPGTSLPAFPSSAEFISRAFTQRNAFGELVRACEGVPRDAINIAILAAQKADDTHIGVPEIRAAGRLWYQRDKEAAVDAHPQAIALLHWIVDEVIGQRQARAFMLRQGQPSNDELVKALYDSRVLHLIKKGVSSRDEPGVRYNVFAIDYGCYVDLLSTTRAPAGLFTVETESGSAEFVDVPTNDYRSIRRAILDLSTFHRDRQLVNAGA